MSLAQQFYLQVHWLTIGAEMAPAAASLYVDLPQIQTVAYQVNITVSTCCAC